MRKNVRLTPCRFDISLNDNPAALHFDVDAAGVECDPNMFTLTPDSFIMWTHHLKSVVVEIG